MKRLFRLGIIFLLLLVSGCSLKEEVSVAARPIDKAYTEVELSIKQPITMGKYEPAQGVYLGAYVDEKIDREQSMKNFEKVLGEKQAFQVFQYRNKNELTSQDILRCIANKQVPYIKLLLEEETNLTKVYQLIGDINSRYNSPIFIELFPVTVGVEDPQTYKEHYEKAYKTIKRHIKDAVIVWAIDLERAYDVSLYYPGNHMVDWVGMNAYWPKYKEGIAYDLNPLEPVDFIYKNFQMDKPMLISSLAVSHFSRIDHTYTIEDAKNKLGLFYKTITAYYPRIKGIFYIDVDMKEVKGLDDYRLSSQRELTAYMQSMLSNPKFLHEVYKQEQESMAQYCNYTVPVLDYDHVLYISETYKKALFKKSILKDRESIEEGKQKYYKLNPLLQEVNGYYTKDKIQ